MRRIILTLSAAFLLLGAGPMLASLHAQAAQSPEAPSAVSAPPAQAANPAQGQQASTAQTFIGKVTKQDEQYMLEDKEKSATYKLDDATKADKFEGKDVKVIGTLDASTNMIHVQSIEESGS